MTSSNFHKGLRHPSALNDALAWLGAPPPADPLLELTPLYRHLAAIATVGISRLQYLKILELFQTRAGLAGSTVKPLLLDATLPVNRHLRTVAQGLMNIHGALAAGYLRLLATVAPEDLAAINRPREDLCSQGLANLMQQFEVAQLISAPPPADFWEKAQGFYRQTRAPSSPLPKNGSAAELAMKCLLALAAAQPEGLSPREMSFLVAYLRNTGEAVSIDLGEPPAGSDSYWLDGSRGFLPTSASRRSPRDETTTLYFSCTALGQSTMHHAARLAAGETPEILNLPREAGLDDYRHVLERAAECWMNPPKRQFSRRRQNCRVQLCTHLGPLWQQLRRDGAATESADDVPVSDWMILNESPAGYAIMHIAGKLFGLLTGSAVGLRTSADEPWQICVVRWARSENPEHIELGLELLAPRAEAVHLARHAPGNGATPIPALLLPALPAMQRGEALLSSRGCFTPGAFTLIDESGSSLRISDCATSRLALHTASLEVFEFERDVKPA